MSQPEKITLATQTLCAELTQRALDAEFDTLYDERGVFKKRRIKTREYWYYQRDIEGKKRYTYVGPVGDPDISNRVRHFADIKSDFKQRREIVRALLAAGLPSPDATTGAVVEALWKAGFFRLRGVLIGTTAFQCYAGILGLRLQSMSLMTQDLDAAQFYDISHMVGDSMPPMLDVLRAVDQTFEPIPDQFDRHRVTRFKTRSHYLVEFVTPNRGSDDHHSKPAPMPALGGASAQPLRYLDFLIYSPIRSVMLYKGGIPVTIPAPERYALHKLIIAPLRKVNPGKAAKDIEQARQLLSYLIESRGYEVYEAWEEAWQRGDKWRAHLTKGVSLLPKDLQEKLRATIATYDEQATSRKKSVQPSSKKAATKNPPASSKPPRRKKS
jgi:hypothetical protein